MLEGLFRTGNYVALMVDSKIKTYWNKVILVTEEITGIKIPEEAWVCLFHGTKMPIKQYMRTLLPHFLNAAKSLIPRQWKDPKSPTVRNWLCKINYIYYAERLRFMGKEGEGEFKLKWQDWLKYKQTHRFAEWMV